MFNNYYDFLYISVNKSANTSFLIMNGSDLSIYSYEFIVDDRNIGGTIHIHFETRNKVETNEQIHILKLYIQQDLFSNVVSTWKNSNRE